MHACSNTRTWTLSDARSDRSELYALEDFADYTRLDDAGKQAVSSRVGRPSILIVESVYSTIDVLQPIMSDYADAIRRAGSKAQAGALIDAVTDVHLEDPDLGDAIMVAQLMGNMAGQLRVRDDAGLLDGARFSLAATGGAQPGDAFLALPWEEAIAEFKARGLVKPDELRRMIEYYADSSQSAREALLSTVQERMRGLLVDALQEGQTLREFADTVELEFPGVSESDPAYLSTVFRTNVQSAYGAGRYRQLEDPDVVDVFPYRQYRTVNDSRVRPSHAKLHDLVWHVSTAGWRRVAPPGGYNCRCSMVALGEEDARGQRIVEDVPEGGEPDEGFDGPPVLDA